MKREDVELAIDGDILRISGHKQEARQEAGAAYRLSERRFGRFERSFPLPPDVDRDAVAAALSDGVLAITLRRAGQAADAKRSQVEIGR
jgi:HSP20 family protein